MTSRLYAITAIVFVFVLGFGLGYHVEALAAVWEKPIVVVEPDRALLRTALAARDLLAHHRRGGSRLAV